jgi:dTDP-4-dehydrorhamnose 3,5-epimerase
MQFKELALQGAFIITSEPRIDHRGSFERSFCANEFKNHGLNHMMVQSNLSKSAKKHTLRGMHFQHNGAEEAKLVRCIKGKIWDVIIDIRPNSSTYCKHIGVELSESNNLLLYVPEGFAHGFITLEDDCHLFYQVSNFYTPNSESGIRWNDPLFGIQWPTLAPIISEKDNQHPDFIAIK